MSDDAAGDSVCDPACRSSPRGGAPPSASVARRGRRRRRASCRPPRGCGPTRTACEDQEHGLERVVGARGNQPTADAVHDRPMPADQFGKRGFVALGSEPRRADRRPAVSASAGGQSLRSGTGIRGPRVGGRFLHPSSVLPRRDVANFFSGGRGAQCCYRRAKQVHLKLDSNDIIGPMKWGRTPKVPRVQWQSRRDQRCASATRNPPMPNIKLTCTGRSVSDGSQLTYSRPVSGAAGGSASFSTSDSRYSLRLQQKSFSNSPALSSVAKAAWSRPMASFGQAK